MTSSYIWSHLLPTPDPALLRLPAKMASMITLSSNGFGSDRMKAVYHAAFRQQSDLHHRRCAALALAEEKIENEEREIEYLRTQLENCAGRLKKPKLCLGAAKRSRQQAGRLSTGTSSAAVFIPSSPLTGKPSP